MTGLILFVDDSHEMLFWADRLKHVGYEVVFFRDPASASAWLDEGHKPDLLICDLLMILPDDRQQSPDEARYEGVKFCRKESTRLEALNCPILVLTGVLDQAVQEAAGKVAARVLEKPAKAVELLEEVKRLTAGRPGRSPAATK